MKTRGLKPENSKPRHGNHRITRATTRPLRGGVLLLFVLGLIFSMLPFICAQSEETAEYPIKLAFLYQFAQFTEWPSGAFTNATAPLVVCVVGEDPFDPDLEQQLLNHSIDQHPMAIMSVKRGASLRGCHMVFVPAPEWKQEANVIDSLRGSSVLTIGESKGFARRGGIINFTIEQNKLHFEINIDAAKETPLIISSKVLVLARIVRDPPHP